MKPKPLLFPSCPPGFLEGVFPVVPVLGDFKARLENMSLLLAACLGAWLLGRSTWKNPFWTLSLVLDFFFFFSFSAMG